MNVIVAAVDDSPAARLVLETAVRLSRVLPARVEALHVSEDGGRTAQAAAAALGVPCRVVGPPVTEAILAALGAPEVTLAVIGARCGAGRSGTIGRRALAVVERAAKPVAVAPPDARPTARPIRRILVPLDGTAESAEAVGEAVHLFAAGGSEIVALHVFDFDDARAPRFLDRPEHDLRVWTREFLARNCAEPGVRPAWRTGAAGDCVVEAATEEAADLVVLAWSQTLAQGRAAVVRETLRRSGAPVLLIPILPAERADESEIVDLRPYEEDGDPVERGTTAKEGQPCARLSGTAS